MRTAQAHNGLAGLVTRRRIRARYAYGWSIRSTGSSYGIHGNKRMPATRGAAGHHNHLSPASRLAKADCMAEQPVTEAPTHKAYAFKREGRKFGRWLEIGIARAEGQDRLDPGVSRPAPDRRFYRRSIAGADRQGAAGSRTPPQRPGQADSDASSIRLMREAATDQRSGAASDEA